MYPGNSKKDQQKKSKYVLFFSWWEKKRWFCCGLLKCVSSRFLLEPPGLKNPEKVEELVFWIKPILNNMLVQLDHSPNFLGWKYQKKNVETTN